MDPVALRQIFDEFDADGDGFISGAELEVVLRRAGLPLDRLPEMIQAADRNHDGLIDEHELAIMLHWAAAANAVVCAGRPLSAEMVARYWSCGTDQTELRGIAGPEPAELSGRAIAERLVFGGAAGAVAKTAVAPLDRLKINMQVSNQPVSIQRVAGEWRRMLVEDGGLRGLFRGNTVQIMRVMPYAALQYTVFDLVKHRLGSEMSTIQRLGAGATAGGVATLLTYPLDVMRARIAVQRGAQAGGTLAAFRAALAQGGVGSLFAGLRPTLLGIVPYAGAAWTFVETGKDAMRSINGGKPASPEQSMVCGAVGGLLAQTITYPIDLVRRRQQVMQAAESEVCVDVLGV